MEDWKDESLVKFEKNILILTTRNDSKKTQQFITFFNNVVCFAVPGKVTGN